MATKRKRKAKPPTFEEWKQACAKHVRDKLSLDDLLDKGDPYDVFEAMAHAYKKGQSPADFVAEIFAEDLARQEYEEEQAMEALDEGEFG